jgi:uncharacterized damage-inducible protein DinB
MNMKKPSEFAQRFEEIYAGEPWFGESIKTKLKNLTFEKAFQQPLSGEHSIAELLNHMEFWRRSILFHLRGDQSISFTADNPENWQNLEVLKSKGWNQLCSAFAETHHALVDVLNADPTLTEDQITYLNGIIEHDIYHLGQIGIVKKIVTQAELV